MDIDFVLFLGAHFSSFQYSAVQNAVQVLHSRLLRALEHCFGSQAQYCSSRTYCLQRLFITFTEPMQTAAFAWSMGLLADQQQQVLEGLHNRGQIMCCSDVLSFFFLNLHIRIQNMGIPLAELEQSSLEAHSLL